MNVLDIRLKLMFSIKLEIELLNPYLRVGSEKLN